LSGKAGYENRSKKRTQDFSRDRETSFKKLTRLTPSQARESSRNALERFFPKIKEAAHLTRRAFSLARRAWREAVTRR
jgi:hypothetical protein